MKSITIFCSSQSNVSPIFFSEIGELAQSLVSSNYRVLYGGSNSGLMGHLADMALKIGGEVIGIVPECFNTSELNHDKLSLTHYTEDLFARKKLMIEQGDAFIIFPGGLGTLDEALEVITLKQIGLIDKPIIFLDLLDFWQPQLESFVYLKEHGMISNDLDSLYHVCKTQKQVISVLNKELGS